MVGKIRVVAEISSLAVAFRGGHHAERPSDAPHIADLGLPCRQCVDAAEDLAKKDDEQDRTERDLSAQ